MKKFKLVPLLIIAFSLNLPANTSRDMGKEPDLSIKLISKWIIFYTNIERLKNGQQPLQYYPELEKAAQWQAEYCARKRDLSHIADVKEMRTIKDRIENFGERCGACGENLSVRFSANLEKIPIFVEEDEKGKYYNFGNISVYWRSERQMAYAMLEGWMNSPGHRKNILLAGFKWLGAGAAKGIYDNNSSYYGCQAFNGYGGLPASLIKAEYDLSGMEAKKTMKNGKEAYIITYSGELVPGIIEVIKDNEIISHELDKNSDGLLFTKNERPKGLLFAALYDKKHDMLYPVLLLK